MELDIMNEVTPTPKILASAETNIALRGHPWAQTAAKSNKAKGFTRALLMQPSRHQSGAPCKPTRPQALPLGLSATLFHFCVELKNPGSLCEAALN